MRAGRSVAALTAIVVLTATGAACTGDDDGPSLATTPPTAEGTAPPPTEVPPSSSPSTVGVPATVDAVPAASSAPPVTSAAGPAPMTITIDLAPSAVWADGSPITAADFECTWRASRSMPGSADTEGYDLITSVTSGSSDRQVVIALDDVYAPYRTLFDSVLQASTVTDCDDVSADFAATPPSAAGPYRVESWDADRAVLVRNEHHAGEPARTERVVLARMNDPVAEAAALQRGEVDFIYPELGPAVAPLVADPAVEASFAAGRDGESVWFQQLDGPLADPVLRAALSMSIDRQAQFDAIYRPAFDAVGFAAAVPDCGPTVPGPYCPAGTFANTFDPFGAAQLLATNGWVRDADGWWSKDGVVPDLRFMVDSGNGRRELAQQALIAQLATLGFRVVADNCDAACVFDQRLPALDYDIAMYTSTARADPAYLTPRFTCEQVPSAESGFVGANVQGWCNTEASDALHRADRTLDPAARATLVQEVVRAMAADHVLLPLATFPTVGAWRPDRVGGPVAAELGNERAFDNVAAWEDVDGDGQVVIGAEQWPACLNPVTECGDAWWYRWAVADLTLPAVWRTTAGGGFEPTDLVVDEPIVTVDG